MKWILNSFAFHSHFFLYVLSTPVSLNSNPNDYPYYVLLWFLLALISIVLGYKSNDEYLKGLGSIAIFVNFSTLYWVEYIFSFDAIARETEIFIYGLFMIVFAFASREINRFLKSK